MTRANKSPSAEDLEGEALEQVLAGMTGSLIEMRAAGGATLDGAKRAELLAAAVAREDVALELDILAYEQKRGERNLNCFRFRDGAMVALGRSGQGNPFLRDHDKWSVDAVSGTVVASRTEKVEDGHYKVFQTVVLKEPRAVERALRGLMHAVSIGARATGPVECSHCGTPVFRSCYHWPGDEVKDADGNAVIVEWIYSSAVLKETSEVPIGAVPTAGPQAIRAAIEASLKGGPAAAPTPPTIQRNDDTMTNLRQAIAAKLNLAATAGDDEITAAVDSLLADRAELAIVSAEVAATRESAADVFIREATASGRISPADDKAWRDFYAAAPDRARARMAERPAGSATPVGQPRQSAASPAPDAAPSTRDDKTKQVLAANGVDFNQAAGYAAAFGAKNPKAALAKHAAGVEEN